MPFKQGLNLMTDIIFNMVLNPKKLEYYERKYSKQNKKYSFFITLNKKIFIFNSFTAIFTIFQKHSSKYRPSHHKKENCINDSNVQIIHNSY